MEKITIECKEDKEKYLEIAKESYLIAKSFFSSENNPEIKIKFLYKREEMDKIKERKTPSNFFLRRF